MDQNARKSSPIDIEIGLKIRALRKSKGLSQIALADKLGLTFQQVQKYENGKNRITCGRIAEIAAALGVPVTWFFGTTDETETEFFQHYQNMMAENDNLRATIKGINSLSQIPERNPINLTAAE